MNCAALVIALGPITSALAAPQKFEVGDRRFQLTLPQGWSRVVHSSKTNALFIGPQGADRAKPVVFVAPMRMKDVNFSERVLNAQSYKYFDARSEQIVAEGGWVIGKTPYRKSKWNGVQEAHSVGIAYRESGGTWSETSTFIACGSEVFHVKTVEPGGAARKTAAQTVARSFACAK